MSHLSTAQISASLDGALTGPDSGNLLAHLSSCVVCREQRDRIAVHDDALRRLFAFEPDHRALDESARAAVERFARFRPPEDLKPTIQQDTTATPADPAQPLPPAREPSRGMRAPGMEPGAQASLEIAPRLDTERAPGATPDPASLLQTYDAFNDNAYVGPATRESPPMLGRPPVKKEGLDDTPSGRKAYRHGGVQRGTPPPTRGDREAPPRRSEGSQQAPPEDGFGVKREQQPAWSRLGLEPDPSSPGSYRETLTGATVSPPPVNTHRRGSRRRSSGRTTLIASLVLVGGLAVVALAMRVPTGGHLNFRLGHDGNGAPAANPGTIDVKSATTPVPVGVAVPPTPGGAATSFDELRLCGQVVDAKGRPVPGALLTVAATTTQARTGADGRFCLQAPAGTQIVEVLDPRGSGTTAHQVQMSFVSGAPEAHVVLP